MLLQLQFSAVVNDAAIEAAIWCYSCSYNCCCQCFCSYGCKNAAVTFNLVNNSAVALVIDYVVEVPNDDSISFISVGAVAKGNGDAVANIARVAVINLVFNDTTVVVVNVAASAVASLQLSLLLKFKLSVLL